MEKKVIDIDLNKSTEIYSTIFILMKRNNCKDNTLKISSNGIMNLVLEDEKIKLNIKMVELNKRYASSSSYKLENSSNLSDFNKFYSYLGQTLGLFVLFNTIDNGNYYYAFESSASETSFFNIKDDIKTTLKMLVSTSHMIDEKNLFVSSMLGNIEDNSPFNSIMLTRKFNDFLDDVSGVDKKGSFIPHNRLMNLCYLSLYYLLIGVIDNFSSTINTDMATFINGLNQGNNIGIQYLERLYLKASTSLHEDFKMFALLNLFYKMSLIQYIFNDESSLNVVCNCARTKDGDIDKSNKLVIAFIELGKNISTFIKEKEELKEIEIDNFFAEQRISGAADILVDAYSYMEMMNMGPETNSTTSGLASVLTGYEMGLFVYGVKKVGLTFSEKTNLFYNLFSTIFDKKCIFYKEDLFQTGFEGLLMSILDPKGLRDLCFNNLLVSLEGNENETIFDTVNIPFLKNKIFFAAYARYAYHNAQTVIDRLDLESTIEEIQQECSASITFLDNLIHNIYSHWFFRDNIIFNQTTKVYKYDSCPIFDMSSQIKAELDILILKYVKFATSCFCKNTELKDEINLLNHAIVYGCRELFVNNITKYSYTSFNNIDNKFKSKFKIDLSSNFRNIANKCDIFKSIVSNESTILFSLFVRDEQGEIKYDLLLDKIYQKGLTYKSVLSKFSSYEETTSNTLPSVINKGLGNYMKILRDSNINWEEKYFIFYIIPFVYIFKKTDTIIAKKIVDQKIFELEKRGDKYKDTIESYELKFENVIDSKSVNSNEGKNLWE